MTNINEIIVNAVSPIISEVHEGIYTGAADEYVNFTYYAMGGNYADSAAGAEIYSVSVGYFARVGRNVTAKRTAIRRALYAAGFTYPSEMNAAGDEDGDGWQHYVFECEYVGEALSHG